MNCIKVTEQTPNHKDLIIAKRSDGVILPSIYFDNSSFCGFFPYTNYYAFSKPNFYSAVFTKTRFENIVEWMLMPE